MALTTAQAAGLLATYGPNAIPQERRSALRTFVLRFWAPVPWLLEATIVLLFLGGRFGDAIAVGFILCFNAFVAAVQEGRARNAMELLQKRVSVRARVNRDGAWKIVPAQELVPGDLIHLGSGDIVPADARLDSGALEVDQSVLTGESAPRSLTAGTTAFAATTVTRGDAAAVVTATGTSTKFGTAAELVRTAKSRGQLERLILRLVSALTAISVPVIVLLSVAAWRYGFSATETIAFAVMILLSSIPVALPAAFTLATTIGSLQLAKRGALVTRLSALEDVASMDVLCVDKTGTITQNRIAVENCVAFAPFTPPEVAALAAAASDDAAQDPVDLAVLAYAGSAAAAPLQRAEFSAFEPSRKYSSAKVYRGSGAAIVYKGAPAAIAMMTGEQPQSRSEIDRAARAGARVLAVAVQTGTATALAGFLALTDPPRPDARDLIDRLRGLGISVMMLTGDAPATALQIAGQVGIEPDAVRASVYPEDKLAIVRDLQRTHAVVGMTGDGINDAPALRQSTVGIAVSSATDVAKSAAGIVLTQPGLADIVAAVESGREIFERMLTYTIMKVVKYFEIIGVLTAGFFVTKHFLMTPELLVVLLVLNDFVTLSISTDNVALSARLDVWKIGRLLLGALPVSLGTALAVAASLFFAVAVGHVTYAQAPSIVFFSMAAMGQIALYVIRSRNSALGLPPSQQLLGASAFALVVASLVVIFGIFTPRVPAQIVLAVLGLLLASGVVLLLLKAALFSADRRFRGT